MTRERMAFGLLTLVVIAAIGFGAGWWGGRTAAGTGDLSDAESLWCANNVTSVLAAAHTLFPDLATDLTPEGLYRDHPTEWSRACAAGYEVLVRYGWETPDEG